MGITFETLDIRSSFLCILYISREYGSGSYMKVIGSRSKSRKKLMVQKSPFLQCKAVVSNNYGSIKHRFMMFGECPCDGGL